MAARPALTQREVNGLRRWATVFHLFPYERIDAHLSVAQKMGQATTAGQPLEHCPLNVGQAAYPA